MTPTRFRRATALLLAATTVLLTASVTSSSSAASFTGRVFRPDGVSPRSAVVVTLVDPQSEQRWASSPTNDEGTFTIQAAPVGTYGLLADTSEGTFLAAKSITLSPGVNRPLALTLTAGEPNYQMAGGPGAGAAGGGLPTWAMGVIAGVVGVGGLFLIDDLTEDTEDAASAF